MSGNRRRRLIVPAFGRLYRAVAPVTELLIRLVAGLPLIAHGYPEFLAPAPNPAFFEQAAYEV